MGEGVWNVFDQERKIRCERRKAKGKTWNGRLWLVGWKGRIIPSKGTLLDRVSRLLDP